MSNTQIKHAIISGAASGIGLAYAKALARRGANISLFDLELPSSVAQAVRAECAFSEQRIKMIEVDISNSQQVRESVGLSFWEFGKPDFAVNAAEIVDRSPFADIDDEQFTAVLNVNLLGSRNFALAVLPYMEAGSNLILNASMAGLTPAYGYSAYSASKFGVIGLAGALRAEYAPLGVSVSVVCPPDISPKQAQFGTEKLDPVIEIMIGTPSTPHYDRWAIEALDHVLEREHRFVIVDWMARLRYRFRQLIPPILRNWLADSKAAKILAAQPPKKKRRF